MSDILNPTPTPGSFTADVLQFVYPHGRRRPTSTELPMEARADYDDMLRCGCRLEAEVLSTGAVSMTVSDPKEEEDVDLSITRNGPEVQAGIVKMLKRRLWNTRKEQPNE